jgi:hypothetical protein
MDFGQLATQQLQTFKIESVKDGNKKLHVSSGLSERWFMEKNPSTRNKQGILIISQFNL